MISDLKDFEKLLKLCRKQGVDEVSLQGVTVKFGAAPKRGKEEEEEPDNPPGDSPTIEQLMFLSAPGPEA